MLICIGVGDGGIGGQVPPPPNSGKNYFFSGKNRVKFGHFVNFFGHISCKIWEFCNFSGKSHVKFGHFVTFSCIFLGKNVLPPQSWLSSYAYADMISSACASNVIANLGQWFILTLNATSCPLLLHRTINSEKLLCFITGCHAWKSKLSRTTVDY